MNPDVIHSGDQGLPKREKLKSRKIIKSVFEYGQAITIPPIRVIYQLAKVESESALPKFSVSVSKRNFANAVQRNRIKRLLREVYRLNKTLLIASCKTYSVQVDILWIYTNKAPAEFKSLEQTAILVLQKLEKKVIRFSGL
ncbi:MAG: ribonuclease P protein component [Saprospiraceae bacterium]|nr:ribonuclease P protein component [Saprospiraceae bacterium]